MIKVIIINLMTILLTLINNFLFLVSIKLIMEFVLGIYVLWILFLVCFILCLILFVFGWGLYWIFWSIVVWWLCWKIEDLYILLIFLLLFQLKITNYSFSFLSPQKHKNIRNALIHHNQNPLFSTASPYLFVNPPFFLLSLLLVDISYPANLRTWWIWYILVKKLVEQDAMNNSFNKHLIMLFS